MLTTTGSKTMGFSEVSTLLWREREALQLLLFKLVEEQLIVSAGHTRWLAQANDEIEAALEQLRGTEVLRAAEVDAIADDLGLPAPPTLAELAGARARAVVDAVRRAPAGAAAAGRRGGARHRAQPGAAGRRRPRGPPDPALGHPAVQTYDAHGSAAATANGPMLMDEQA